MRLVYIGPNPATVGIVPLPEGWPALDHEEPDEALAAEKVESGSYAPAEPFGDAEPDTAAEAPQKPDERPSRRSRRAGEDEE